MSISEREEEFGEPIRLSDSPVSVDFDPKTQIATFRLGEGSRDVLGRVASDARGEPIFVNFNGSEHFVIVDGVSYKVGRSHVVDLGSDRYAALPQGFFQNRNGVSRDGQFIFQVNGGTITAADCNSKNGTVLDVISGRFASLEQGDPAVNVFTQPLPASLAETRGDVGDVFVGPEVTGSESESRMISRGQEGAFMTQDGRVAACSSNGDPLGERARKLAVKYPDGFVKGNEDSVLVVPGKFYAVADGMGGMGHGELASSAAVEGLRKYMAGIHAKSFDAANFLRAMVEEIRGELGKLNNPDADPGTTIAALRIIDDSYAEVLTCGDSKVYMLRLNGDGNWVLCFESEDQSRVGSIVKSREMDEVDAMNLQGSQALEAWISQNPRNASVVSSKREYESGDVALLLSDGYSDVVSRHETLMLFRDAYEYCKNQGFNFSEYLSNYAFAKQAGVQLHTLASWRSQHIFASSYEGFVEFLKEEQRGKNLSDTTPFYDGRMLRDVYRKKDNCTVVVVDL